MDWYLQVILWYTMLMTIGALFFPLTSRILPVFYDKGYAFSKIVGIILISYTMFVLGTFHILPFSLPSLIIIIIFWLAVNFKIGRHHFSLTDNQFKIIFIEEALGISAFFFWAYIRSQEPDIHGLEKFMDFGFINAALRGDYFPAKDMWLAGKSINYYYFGHLTGAILTKLSTLPSYITYNLILAQLFALGVTQTFSLGFTCAYQGLKKNRRLALVTAGLAAFIVNLGGNLHTIYSFTTGYGSNPAPIWTLTPKFSLQDLLHPIEAYKKLPASYWYPDATRFIPSTIHEFPIYSYVVADLHGHVFAIPIVLLSLGVILSIFIRSHADENTIPLSSAKKLLTWLRHDLPLTKGYLGYSVILGFLLSTHLMTNAFDLPIYLGLTAIILLMLTGFSLRFFAYMITLIASFVIFNLPFSLGFEPFASGFGVNCAPQNITSAMNTLLKDSFLEKRLIFEGNCQSSAWWMLMTLWGFFWFNFTFLILSVIKRKFEVSRVTMFMLILCAYSSLLIIAPEIVYAKDIYPGHFRANTMFKLGYQAFMMYGLASAFTFGYFKVHAKGLLPKIYFVLFAILFFFIAIYPQFAINSYYGTRTKELSLDGTTWINNTYAEYDEIIRYFRTHVKGQPTILEAQGDSYTDFNVVSAYTGLPTVAGWWVHQWLWRGDSAVVGKLIPDIEEIYKGVDIEKTKALIRKHHISYIVIGKNEREKYKEINEDKFEALGRAVFTSSQGTGVIYQIPIDTN